MKGYILSIHPGKTARLTEHTAPATLEQLREAVGGGWLEAVPHFNYIPDHKNNVVKCVVFCDEEGKLKQLEINKNATALWFSSCKYQKKPMPNDMLVGPIAIVYGDKEFMEDL